MQLVRETVRNPVGLHARPAALFVQTANKFRSRITIRNVTGGGTFVNAKSILHILALGAEQGHQVELVVEGEDEATAAESLKQLLLSDFAVLPTGEKP